MEKDLSCPVDKKNYLYIYPNYRNNDKIDIFPILRDQKAIHRNCINVLMSDSGVMTIPADKLDESIMEYNKQAKQNKRPFQM